MTGRPMTKATSRLRTASLLALALAFMAAPPLMHPAAARAETAAGTVISNTATATFSEPNSSNSYAIQSDTVSVTVWDAPTVTVSNPASRTVAPSDYVITNSFVLTNTGNASGDFQLTQNAQFNDSNASLAGYTLRQQRMRADCRTLQPLSTQLRTRLRLIRCHRTRRDRANRS